MNLDIEILQGTYGELMVQLVALRSQAKEYQARAQEDKDMIARLNAELAEATAVAKAQDS